MEKDFIEIAIIGPDGTGKSSIVEDIADSDLDLSIVKITNYRYNGLTIRSVGRALDSMTSLGDRLNSRFVSGLGYLGCLFLFPFARAQAMGKKQVVLYERHPRYDTDIYMEVYLSKYKRFGGILKGFFKGLFNFTEPDEIIYLSVGLENALERARIEGDDQIHNNPDDLEQIIHGFDAISSEIQERGSPTLICIDTTRKGLEETKQEVRSNLDRIIMENPLTKKGPRKLGFLGTAREIGGTFNPLSEEQLIKTMRRLAKEGKVITYEDITTLIEANHEEQYTIKHLGFCAAISFGTPHILGTSWVTSTPIRTVYNLFWLGRELYKMDWDKAWIHLSVLPLIWIPKIGGICYLIPLTMRNPELGMTYAYQISSWITSKDPDELMEKIGSLKPSRKAVQIYDQTPSLVKSTVSFPFRFAKYLAMGLYYDTYAVTYPINEKLRSMSENYDRFCSAGSMYFDAAKKTKRLIYNELTKPNFLKGAREAE